MSQLNAALLLQFGNFFGSELPEFDGLSCPCFLPFQPSAFTFGHCGFGFVFFHGKITSRIFAGFSVERTLRGCFCFVKKKSMLFLKFAFYPLYGASFAFLQASREAKPRQECRMVSNRGMDRIRKSFSNRVLP